MGIHGEPGHRRVSPIPPLKELISQLLELLTSTTDPDRSYLPFQGNDDKVVLLINNLGATSELELCGIVSEVRRLLVEMRIDTQRILCGTFMASIPTSTTLA
jgi:dihydroxyacetone kinase